VPCPAGEGPSDATEADHLRGSSGDQTAGEDARADDDGMPAHEPPRPKHSGRLS